MNSALFFLQSDFVGDWIKQNNLISQKANNVCKVSNLRFGDVVSSGTVDCCLSSGDTSLQIRGWHQRELYNIIIAFTASKGFRFLFVVFLQMLAWTSILSLSKFLLQFLHWTRPGLGANFALVLVFALPGLSLPLTGRTLLISIGGFLRSYSSFLSCFRTLETLLGSTTWNQEVIKEIHLSYSISIKHLHRNFLRRRLTFEFSGRSVSIFVKFWFFSVCRFTEPFFVIFAFRKVLNWL